MKAESKNQILKELAVCFGLACIVSFFIVQFIISNKPTFVW